MPASPSTSDPRRELPRIPASAASRWQVLVLLAATAVLAWPAARLMFSAFMFYDDEGYVLISLKNFAEHGGLYRDVYSQYGPFPFVAWWLLHELGLPLTHLTGRLVTLGAWLGVAAGGAAIVWRATRRLPAALATLAGLVAYLWIMVSEPAHPGGLIALTLAAAATLGHRWLAADRPGAWALLVGAAAAALALTKINVGGFAVLSGLAWILLHHENAAVRRWMPAVLGAGAVLVPLALMRPMLELPWVQTFALAFACSALAVLVADGGEARPGVGWRTLGRCCAAGAAVAAAVLAVVLARGSSVADLLDGVLLGPLRHPKAFSLGYTWPAGAAAAAVVSLGLAVAARQLRRRGTAAVDTAVAVLRLAAAAGAAAAVLRFPGGSPDRLIFGFGAPCLWLFCWRLPGEGGAAKAATSWLALLWLGQYLHPFPVAGSQIAWGTFLALPIAAVGASGAAEWLAARRAPAVAVRRLVPAAVLALAVVTGARCFQAGDRYRDGSDLGLPGAEFLRLPSEASALFRLLALNAAAHGDVLFSEPGMFSLNLWSGRPTPTRANVTHWFSLLGPERQRAIVAALAAEPRAAVIVQREHIDYLTRRNFAPAGELHEFIAREFVPVFTLDNFEFRVRAGRRIEPLMLGEMEVLSEEKGRENTALRLRVLLPPGRDVARIEVAAMKPAELAPPLVFDAANARVETLGAAPRPLAWPWRAETPVTIRVYFDRFAQQRPVAGALIVLRDAAGEEVALARLRE
jgi:hypothetical protein